MNETGPAAARRLCSITRRDCITRLLLGRRGFSAEPQRNAARQRLFDTWAEAGAAGCGNDRREATDRALSPVSSLGSKSISLPKAGESAAISEDLRGGEPTPEPSDLQALITAAATRP